MFEFILLSVMCFIGGFVTSLIFNLITRTKPLGKIILSRDGYLYIELNDEESLNKITSTNSVTFTVKRE